MAQLVIYLIFLKGVPQGRSIFKFLVAGRVEDLEHFRENLSLKKRSFLFEVKFH